MYRFSRAIYRELADDVLEDPHSGCSHTHHARVLHACEAETSMMLATEPSLVDHRRLAEARGPDADRPELVVLVGPGVFRWASAECARSMRRDRRGSGGDRGERRAAAGAAERAGRRGVGQRGALVGSRLGALGLMVRAVGVEPTLCCQNRILSPARLPIPPRPQHRPICQSSGAGATANAGLRSGRGQRIRAPRPDP